MISPNWYLGVQSASILQSRPWPKVLRSQSCQLSAVGDLLFSVEGISPSYRSLYKRPATIYSTFSRVQTSCNGNREGSDQRSDHCREEDISSGELMLTARECGKFDRSYLGSAHFSCNQYTKNCYKSYIDVKVCRYHSESSPFTETITATFAHDTNTLYYCQQNRTPTPVTAVLLQPS